MSCVSDGIPSTFTHLDQWFISGLFINISISDFMFQMEYPLPLPTRTSDSPQVCLLICTIRNSNVFLQALQSSLFNVDGLTWIIFVLTFPHSKTHWLTLNNWKSCFMLTPMLNCQVWFGSSKLFYMITKF